MIKTIFAVLYSAPENSSLIREVAHGYCASEVDGHSVYAYCGTIEEAKYIASEVCKEDKYRWMVEEPIPPFEPIDPYGPDGWLPSAYNRHMAPLEVSHE